jgi:hypothetical protein
MILNCITKNTESEMLLLKKQNLDKKMGWIRSHSNVVFVSSDSMGPMLAQGVSRARSVVEIADPNFPNNLLLDLPSLSSNQSGGLDLNNPLGWETLDSPLRPVNLEVRSTDPDALGELHSMWSNMGEGLIVNSPVHSLSSQLITSPAHSLSSQLGPTYSPAPQEIKYQLTDKIMKFFSDGQHYQQVCDTVNTITSFM